MNEFTKNRVWRLSGKVPGKDPNLYRVDPYGNVCYRPSHGKNSDMGWEIDHIKPVSRGGTNAIRNVQILNTRINRSKGNTLVKKSRHSKRG